MNKDEKFVEELFAKTEETEAVKPQTTEIVQMAVGKIVPNFRNPYKCREEDMKPLEDSIRENGIISLLWYERMIRLMCSKLFQATEDTLQQQDLKSQRFPLLYWT